MNHETHLVPMERPKDKTDIRWQVHEWLFPRSPNLYAAVDPLITEVNAILKNPNVPDDDKWLFRPKDGQPPSIEFLLYENIVHNRQTTALVFDAAFTIRVFTAGQDIIALPMGHIDDTIYYAYWTAKSPGKDIPPLPKDIVSGWLKPESEGFVLDSIYLYGYDGRPSYELATAVPGFSNKEYADLSFWLNMSISEKFKEERIAEILTKNKRLTNPEETRKQLLAYNPEK
jgi:hypothetical protein